jgi:cytosine/uracil/thiamine/allantoin permease
MRLPDVHTVFDWYCFAVPFIALAIVLWGVEEHNSTKRLVQIEKPGQAEYTLQAIMKGLRNE